MDHKTLSSKGCEVHYWHRPGTGSKSVVFLHGAGCDHRMFNPQLPIFDETFNLFLIDARGHGLSKLKEGTSFCFEDMLADFWKLCEIHKLSDLIIIGQSMGGNLAQEILFLTPEIISKLVLIDCARNSGNLTPSEKLSLKLSKPILRWYPWKALIGQSADACGNSKHVKEYVKECLSMMRKQDFIKVMESTFSCLREDPHYRFPKPALLICGEDDRSGNIRKTAAPWAAADANVVLSMIQNAGHNSNQDNPDDVNKAICEFLSLDPSDIKKL